MCVNSRPETQPVLTSCFDRGYAKRITIESCIQLADGLGLPVRKVQLQVRRWNPTIVGGQQAGAGIGGVARL